MSRSLAKPFTLTIQMKIKPNARVSLLVETAAGVWYARLKAQPIDGKASDELTMLLAKHFGCPRSAVSIKSGASGRMKLVRTQTG